MKSARTLFIGLFVLNLLNYIDRQVLYAVFPLLQRDLQLTDVQLGALASAFMLVYMCYAPMAGYWADRTSRPRLIGLSALLWSGATLLCAAAKNYTSLLISRALIGVGEGGFTTVAQPFLAEHYPKANHAFMLALFGLALPIGSALGYMLGGFVGQHWGWKAAFMCVGIPGVLVGLWMLGFNDLRQLQPRSHRPGWKEYSALLRNRPFLKICFAQAMSTFVMGGLSAWMPMYIHRYTTLSASRAGLCFGILLIACGAAGTLAGGQLAARLFARTRRAYAYIISGAFLVALPCCWGALMATHPVVLFAWLGAALCALFVPTGAIAASLVATTSPQVRAMAFAVNIFIIHLLGDAFSPTAVGWLSELGTLKAAVFCCTLVLLPGAWAVYKTEMPA